MGEKIIKKNFKLSAEFNEYAIKHPEIFDNVPKNVCIVMMSKDDEKLSRANSRLIKKGNGCKYFKAIKENRRWSLESA